MIENHHTHLGEQAARSNIAQSDRRWGRGYSGALSWIQTAAVLTPLTHWAAANSGRGPHSSLSLSRSTLVMRLDLKIKVGIVWGVVALIRVNDSHFAKLAVSS